MQRAIEEIGIPTVIIAALPPVVKQTGTPRAVAPLVPMGANAGEPHNMDMQYGIVKEALEQLSQDAQLRELWSQRAEIPSGEYRSKLNVICNGNITLENKELRKYEKWYAYNRPTGIR